MPATETKPQNISTYSNGVLEKTIPKMPFEDFQKLSISEKADYLSNSMNPNRPEMTMEEIVAELKATRTERKNRMFLHQN
jgi:hypothetical protein